MKKTTLAIAIGALVASHAGLAETKISKVSPTTDTPTYLKQAKPAEAPSGTLVFAPEILSLTYYYARVFRDPNDRYAQALLYRRVALDCFAAAQS
jgi:hypothetical protein